MEQQTPIGFSDPTIRELARAAVSLEAALVLERQQHAAAAEAWRQKEAGYLTRASEDATMIQMLRDQLAARDLED